MNIFKKIYCRVFQAAFHSALPILPYREPQIFRKIEDLPSVIERINAKSVLFITDGGLRASSVTERAEKLIENCAKLTVYDKTCANPTVKNVEEALEVYNREGCDCLVAFGGGSSMDCAKAVGARVAYPEKSLGKLKGTLRVLRKIPTLIAIPTTAGTGSEVTLAAVITDGEKKHKYTMNDFSLIPSYAVLDPEVTFSLPPLLTATTGMDALTHAVEAYIGRSTSRETREKAHKKLYELGKAAGVVSDGDGYKEGAEKFIGAIREMNARMSIPEKLSGIKSEDIPVMAEHADREANPLYPVPVLMDAKRLEKFYYKVSDRG